MNKKELKCYIKGRLDMHNMCDECKESRKRTIVISSLNYFLDRFLSEIMDTKTIGKNGTFVTYKSLLKFRDKCINKIDDESIKTIGDLMNNKYYKYLTQEMKTALIICKMQREKKKTDLNSIWNNAGKKKIKRVVLLHYLILLSDSGIIESQMKKKIYAEAGVSCWERQYKISSESEKTIKELSKLCGV